MRIEAMTYDKAIFAARDETITDRRELRKASSFLLGQRHPSDEDIADAENLAWRSIKLGKATAA